MAGGMLEDAATEEPKRRNVTRAIFHNSNLSRVYRACQGGLARVGVGTPQNVFHSGGSGVKPAALSSAVASPTTRSRPSLEECAHGRSAGHTVRAR